MMTLKEERYDQLEMSSNICSDDERSTNDLFESPGPARRDDFSEVPSSVLSPRGAARAKLAAETRANAQQLVSLSSRHTSILATSPMTSDVSDMDEAMFDTSASHHEKEKKSKRNRLKQKLKNISLDDDRFRVNGIVVDQEIRGGPKPHWQRVYQVLFQSSTPRGQQVALALLIMVSLSVIIAILDSVNSIRDEIGDYLLALEIFFTSVFTVEYVLRVLCLRRPRQFMLSYLGFIDICALVPTYLGVFLPTARPLMHLAVLRIFRVLRVFRVLRLARFVDASAALSDNIEANKRRITVFLMALFTMILVIGCAMYLIEGDRHGFSNIPVSLYWTVVTITTVGYGDLTPQTIPGRMLATVVMFSGYGVIACPLVLNTGGDSADALTEVVDCPRCFRRRHQEDANFCRVCGTALRQPRGLRAVKAQHDRKTRMHKKEDRSAASTSTTSIISKRVEDEDEDSTQTTVDLESALGVEGTQNESFVKGTGGNRTHIYPERSPL